MKNVSTRFLLTCAAIGVASGIVLIPIFITFSAAAVAAAPLLYAAVVGVWFLPGAFAQALLRRGGAAALTSLIAGLVCVPFTPYGWSAVASTLTVGILQELPFAATLYRYWKAWLFYVWSVVVGVLYSFLLWSSYGAESMPAWVQLVMIPIVAVSAFFFTWLGRFIAGRVAKTGVVKGLQLPEDRRKRTLAASAATPADTAEASAEAK